MRIQTGNTQGYHPARWPSHKSAKLDATGLREAQTQIKYNPHLRDAGDNLETLIQVETNGLTEIANQSQATTSLESVFHAFDVISRIETPEENYRAEAGMPKLHTSNKFKYYSALAALEANIAKGCIDNEIENSFEKVNWSTRDVINNTVNHEKITRLEALNRIWVATKSIIDKHLLPYIRGFHDLFKHRIPRIRQALLDHDFNVEKALADKRYLLTKAAEAERAS